MSDEEKQAIKDCDNIFICLDDCMSEDSANDYRKSYKILKNLIEKQSKIIEKLYKSIEDEIGNIINLGVLVDENAREKRDVSKYIDEVQIFLNTLNYNYVSKDKIKPIQIIDLDGKIHNVYKIEEE